jgi:hypothetical protein
MKDKNGTALSSLEQHATVFKIELLAKYLCIPLLLGLVSETGYCVVPLGSPFSLAADPDYT